MPIIISASEFAAQTYDYVIVGGGTAGLVVAGRLAEDPSITVAIIEAGHSNIGKIEVDSPDLVSHEMANPEFDWNLFSVPQPHANDRKVFQSRGKGLGGSSLLNFLAWFRPSKPELDALSKFTDTKGWDWEGLLPYLKKSESLVLPDPSLAPSIAEKIGVDSSFDPALYGSDGPIKVSLPNMYNKQYGIISETTKAFGFKNNTDLGHKGSNVGAMTCLLSLDPIAFKRSYAASAYLDQTNSNLNIVCDAVVSKVILEDGGNIQIAKGAEFIDKDGQKFVVHAKREVIISCGTLKTPQILELSGIGNPDILAKAGIETKVELVGVGENLQDHICVPHVVESDSSSEVVDFAFNKEYVQYNEAGATTSVNAVSFIFANSKEMDVDVESYRDKADAGLKSQLEGPLKISLERQATFLKKWMGDDNLAQGELIIRSAYQHLPPPLPLPGKTYATITAALCHPLSHGSVHIASSSPTDSPVIDPKYFSNPADLDVLVKLIKLGIKIRNSPPFSSVARGWVFPPQATPDGGPTPFSGYSEHDDEKIQLWIKTVCTPVFHQVGTASMGRSKEEGAVVDGELKVFGVKNLRVVDASVLPIEMSTHIQATVYAIAEKAADIIKASQT